MMTKTLYRITLCLFCGLSFMYAAELRGNNATKSDIAVVEQLVQRLMPGQAEKFSFKIDAKKGKKYYRLITVGQKIRIEGDSPVSLASGLHRYMRDYLHAEVSWTDLQPKLKTDFPLPETMVSEESPYSFVTYMNYCTFGYSTVFWDWDRWEKEIDWMALHGITHPLAMVGAENVWYNFLLKIGYSDQEARSFLTGPVYMPWLLMGNMETLGGTMSDEWLQRQQRLQNKIVERMRSYGMTPVFQAFYGMVPSSYKTKFPRSKVVEQGKWNTFTRPDVLSPLDTEFDRLAQLWYEEYTLLYGKTDYYAGDLFHEGGKTGGLDITACARSVEASLLKFNPEAVWVLQSWGNNPLPELLKGLDPNHALVVELCAEYWHRWKDDGGYDGIPWAWSNISNWGGNIGIHGRLDAIASEPISAQKDGKASKTLVGIGFTPEGIETNPVVPALWSDMVWTKESPDISSWIKQYPRYRYGSELPSLQKAWTGFYQTAYGTYPGARRPSEPIFCAQPSLNVKTVSAWSQCKIFYDPELFACACNDFLQDAVLLKENVNYQYDAVDMVRQYLSDLGRNAYAAIQQAWKDKDRKTFDQKVERFLQLIQDQDKLLLSNPAFCLQPWLQSASEASKYPGIQSQYEYYNRLIVTSWDTVNGSLNDYTHRELGGLLGTYYYKRWRLYFNYLSQSWDNPSLPAPDIFGITKIWRYEDIREAIDPSGENPVEVAGRLFYKYRSTDN